MARDKLGFEVGRRCDARGRPLRLTSRPLSDRGRREWDRIFKKPRRRRADADALRRELQRGLSKRRYPEKRR